VQEREKKGKVCDVIEIAKEAEAEEEFGEKSGLKEKDADDECRNNTTRKQRKKETTRKAKDKV